MANALIAASVVSSEHLGDLAASSGPAAPEAFAGLARMAADILGVPLAAIAVADGERLRFLGEVGFGLGEMPLSASVLMPRLTGRGNCACSTRMPTAAS